jgi:hypothetical protein
MRKNSHQSERKTLLKSRVAASALFAISCLLVVSSGCGASTASVQGSVSYQGVAIEKGMITFTPVDGKGPVVGCNIENGKYLAEGVTPGKNILHVVSVKQVTFSRTSEEMSKMAANNAAKGPIEGLIDPADLVPADAVGNSSEHNLIEGSNTIDLQLTKP